ncbi:VOC family protein [Actinacidiphila soli]|uniref:VOC family protein n=1 Tax=Actinacidiphila soli TaxID=2487275 RepID=UPI002AFF4D35|nr:VOC family protein [Actinacidiphila soli]
MARAPRFSLTSVVLDGPDAHALADFYRRLLSWEVAATDETATTKVSPYPTSTATRTTLSQDSIYGGGSAQDGLPTLSGSATVGYTGTLTLGVDA